MANAPENTDPQASTPDARAEQEGRQNTPPAGQDAAPDAQGPGAIPASTQTDLGSGDGIRGSYGDASQTNGLEGGPDSAPDGSPGQ